MHLPFIVITLLAGLVSRAAAATKGISPELYNRLVHYLTISQATYNGSNCNITSLPRMYIIRNETWDLYGWVLRDDKAKEIVVAYRGSVSPVNSQLNRNFTLGNIRTLPECVGCMAQGGYITGFESIMDQVLGYVKKAVKKHRHYRLVVTGHR